MKAQDIIKDFIEYLEEEEIDKKQVTCEVINNYLMSLNYEMQDAKVEDVEETTNDIEKIIKQYVTENK